MTEPDIRAAYRELCPGIAGRILTEHEAAEADAMRAALVDRLLWTAARSSRSHEGAAFSSTNRARSAAWATVLALLLAPEAA